MHSSTSRKAKAISILLLEDNSADAQLTIRYLLKSGLNTEIDVSRDDAQFQAQVAQKHYDIVLGDYGLSNWTGLDAFLWLRSSGYDMPFILVTGSLGDETAVECIRQGISDYILKERLDRLPIAISRALEERSTRLARDRAERDLRQSIEQYRSIVEGAPYGICRIDSGGRFRMVNSALVAMLGFESHDALLAANAADIFAQPQEIPKVLLGFQTNQSSPIEVLWRRSDGGQIHAHLAGRQFPSEMSNQEVYEIFVEDITRQRVLEREFLQAQKMEAVGRLAGSVAHDFNNTLMIIGGSAELLAQQIKPEKNMDYIRQIQRATDMAAGIVRQLLAFSRKQIPERRVMDLNSVLSDLTKMLPRLLGEDIEVKIVSGKGPKYIWADRGYLEQVVLNLAVNARDAMPGGGILMIKTDGVEVDGQNAVEGAASIPSGSYITLQITDTGIGMDANVRTHIFEPFFTTKERDKGTGLGLSTVYGIVKQSDGHIFVDSAPGKGTTFTMFFPTAQTQGKEAKANNAVTAVPGGPESILVVEDQTSLRELVTEYLESKGYAVLSAGSGRAGLELVKIQAKPVDLLITDVILPGMPGTELAAAMIQRSPGTRVLYISGYTDRPISLQAFGPHTAYLQKPFSLVALGEKIRTVLEKPANPDQADVTLNQEPHSRTIAGTIG